MKIAPWYGQFIGILYFASSCGLEGGTGGGELSLREDVLGEIMDYIPEASRRAAETFKRTMRMEAKQAASMRGSGRSGRSRNTFRFVQLFLGSTPYGKHLSYPAYYQTEIMETLRIQLTTGQLGSLFTQMPLLLAHNDIPMTELTPMPRPSMTYCPYPRLVRCDPSVPFRTYDGRCNNLERPLLGASHQPLARFLPPNYADGLRAPRISVTGRYLPSARLVSASLHWDYDRPHPLHTLMVMQMGQFLDHDLSRTAITKIVVDSSGYGEELEDVECGYDGCQTKGLENRECFPISIPYNDTSYKHSDKNCLMFVRSLEVPNAYCKPGSREQLNQLTSYLDSSHIYGSTRREAYSLRKRTRARGRMATVQHPAGDSYKPMIPYDEDEANECLGRNSTLRCFRAGDGRVNEFSGLTTQHIIWVREHNRIESVLHVLNPHWRGERLYQETRRIIGAMWLQCVYGEYLPLILGPHIMNKYGLTLSQHGHWNGYDSKVDPSVANSFATAAMRFGHTQIQGKLTGRNTKYSVTTVMSLSTQLRRPYLMYESPEEGMDMMMLGMIGQSAQIRDPFITNQVTSHLFSDEPPHGHGEDLMSLNIQRGRDHGLPGYNSYREWCGLPRARSFEELKELPEDVMLRMKGLYAHVDDVDLWPGGVTEKEAGGSILGPTFTCILARQFRNAKFGDRFWFENNKHNPYPFTPAQLATLRNVRYSKILCRNADYIPYIQPNIFLHPLSHVLQFHRSTLDLVQQIKDLYGPHSNERQPCGSLPDLDLSLWREVSAPPPFYQRPPLATRPGAGREAQPVVSEESDKETDD